MTEPARKPPKFRKSWGPAVFRLAAISNWLVTVVAVVDPQRGADLIALGPLSHPYLFRIWAGMAFLWGIFFWEIAGDLDGKRRMIKYAWLEKTVTAVSVTIAYYRGEVGIECMGMVLFTDYLWIPLFIFYQVRTAGNPSPTSALARARATLGLSDSPGAVKS